MLQGRKAVTDCVGCWGSLSESFQQDRSGKGAEQLYCGVVLVRGFDQR
jgi:hypothetical protein